MKSTWQIPRRTFLKGLGTAMALPPLEAMLFPSHAAETAEATKDSQNHDHDRRTTSNQQGPVCMAFVYVPNGANMADWTPRTEGTEFELPSILEPLKPFQKDLQVLSGLAHRKADPNGDGGGDHARASATFLTGVQARKTAAVDVRVGISVDQIAAQRIGHQTRLSSLELGCDKGQQAGSCDSGYSCAYQFNLAWKTDNTPLPPEVDPRLVFDRLFSNGVAGEADTARARRRDKSVLDFVLEDSHRLKARLGATDRLKVDEYLSAVREIEQRLEQAERFAAASPNYARPTAIPRDYHEHIRMLFDLLALAFQTDTTRVSTFMLAHDGSNRSYPFAGVSEGHHDLSHHGDNEEKKRKIARINRFHVEQFAYFIGKLKSIREGDGTLLDRCMIVYGSGISDGNAHSHSDLPVLLAGRAKGSLAAGRHVRFPAQTPMTNLYLSLLDRMGAPTERLGDSTGLLARLD